MTAAETRYDPDNIFARVLRGEIPNETVAESTHALAFRDIRPQAPVHVLVIPKGPYVDAADFGARASDEEITDFARLLAKVAASEGVDPASGGSGFRTISNAGTHGVQEVPHYHVHVLGGATLGRMLPGM
ncbi:HIT domain-containing protein [Paracoccus suum]|uniref:HIT domain-containing protein n=1 Tax=Paracoccus suum TaxID=2259340 RepID=A0A344PM90_9RHOB|nr:HIT domain-containing protein [Paracoccus suum]AXC50495.1 HIT domain-containing protein [Paracoccus suum]